MKRLAALLLVVGLCASCAKKEMDGGVQSAAMLAEDAPAGYLALEHAIELDAPEARIAGMFDATKAACAQVPRHGCTVLEAQVNSGERASSRVKMRATPDGVRAVIAALAPQGKLVKQSTHAEDLAKPIQDGVRKIAMLTEYRATLEALASAPGVDTDALIKLNRELVEVQSQLEALSGAQAHLNLRVQTEILTVNVSEISSGSFGKPITAALDEFTSNLSKGIALTISAVAFLIPAGLMLALLVAAWKAVRGRIRQRRHVAANARPQN